MLSGDLPQPLTRRHRASEAWRVPRGIPRRVRVTGPGGGPSRAPSPRNRGRVESSARPRAVVSALGRTRCAPSERLARLGELRAGYVDSDVGLVTDDPSVMTGRNVDCIAGAKLHLLPSSMTTCSLPETHSRSDLPGGCRLRRWASRTPTSAIRAQTCSAARCPCRDSRPRLCLFRRVSSG